MPYCMSVTEFRPKRTGFGSGKCQIALQIFTAYFWNGKIAEQ